MRTLGFISLVAASGHHRTRPKEVRGSKPPYTLLIAEFIEPMSEQIDEDEDIFESVVYCHEAWRLRWNRNWESEQEFQLRV